MRTRPQSRNDASWPPRQRAGRSAARRRRRGGWRGRPARLAQPRAVPRPHGPHRRVELGQQPLREIHPHVHVARAVGVEVEHRRLHPLQGGRAARLSRTAVLPHPGSCRAACRWRLETNSGRSRPTVVWNGRWTPSEPAKPVNVPHSWTTSRPGACGGRRRRGARRRARAGRRRTACGGRQNGARAAPVTRRRVDSSSDGHAKLLSAGPRLLDRAGALTVVGSRAGRAGKPIPDRRKCPAGKLGSRRGR